MKQKEPKWKTKEQFTQFDWLLYRAGKILYSKIDNGITYWKC